MASIEQHSSSEAEVSVAPSDTSDDAACAKSKDDVADALKSSGKAISAILDDADKIEQHLNRLKTVANMRQVEKTNQLLTVSTGTGNASSKDFKSVFDDDDDLKHDNKQFSNVANRTTDSETSIRNLSLESELNNLRKQNEDLTQKNQEHDSKILELAGKVEMVQEKIDETSSEINQVHRMKEAESLNTSSSLYTSSSLNREPSSLQQQQPTSLPSFRSGINSRSLSKLQLSQNQLKSSEAHAVQLKQINLNLQARNQHLENKMQQLQEQHRQRLEIVQQLNAKINPNSPDSRLNPKQQQYYDDFRRRLELQVEHYKKASVEAEQLAQRNKAAAEKKQTDAENKHSELQRRVTQLEAEDKDLAATTQELSTALVVATRVSPQSITARYQATIETLSAAARRLEDEMRRVSNEYDSAVAEKLRLQEEVHQLQSRRPVHQTIYSRAPGSGIIMQSGSNRIIINNEDITISQETGEDIPDDFQFD